MGQILLGTVHLLFTLQSAPGTIAGTVRDATTGEPLSGAIVSLTELHRTAITDAQGWYVFLLVSPGPHHITARAIGHAPRSLHAIVPRDGALAINVALRPEPVRLQPVDVAAAAGAPGDRTAYPDRVTATDALWENPLMAEPDIFQGLQGGEVTQRPESPGGLHVRGGSSDQVAYLLDGIPVFSPYHAAGVFSAWNPDALFAADLAAATPPPGAPSTLAGTVEGITRTPGSQSHAQGGLSTTQARLTLDGPVGVGGFGYLVSARTGFPGVFAPRKEASYLRGEIGDWLAKLEGGAVHRGGRLRLLGYASENDLSALAVAEGVPGAPLNGFEWTSQSLGAEWSRMWTGITVTLRGWNAMGRAGARWALPTGDPITMRSARQEDGVLASITYHAPEREAITVVGLRMERSRTSYGTAPGWELAGRATMATAFAQHDRPIGMRVALQVGASLAAAVGGWHFSPHAQLRWRPSERLSFSGSVTRQQQFTQSLRNAESVVGSVFPVDLAVNAGAPGVPVARSTQGVIAAEFAPAVGVRLGLQAYQRGANGLLLVAPRGGQPFTTGVGGFVRGSGTSRGVSLNAGLRTARINLVATYGLEGTQLSYGDSSYVPEQATAQRFDGGIVVFPSATTSIRLGASGALGRRTTPLAGGLEWEACNLLDQGCEFGGSPYYAGEPLGRQRLPAYLRVDLGFRKHWHWTIASRDAVLAVFGTVANILNRHNVLTYNRDPATGQLIPIEMRPLAPLVVGLDWRF